MTNSLTYFEVTGEFVSVSDPSILGTQSDPVIQPINALATFVPRPLKGQLLYVTDYLVTAAYNAVQTVFLLGDPDDGTWTLEFVDEITDPPLDWDISIGDLQAALEALPT